MPIQVILAARLDFRCLSEHDSVLILWEGRQIPVCNDEVAASQCICLPLEKVLPQTGPTAGGAFLVLQKQSDKQEEHL
jgi:hypothetical protein